MLCGGYKEVSTEARASFAFILCLTLLFYGITSDLCLNQIFRTSHRFGKREYEAKVGKFKQTYYFSFKLKYIS